jgi:hypothetical protein
LWLRRLRSSRVARRGSGEIKETYEIAISVGQVTVAGSRTGSGAGLGASLVVVREVVISDSIGICVVSVAGALARLAGRGCTGGSGNLALGNPGGARSVAEITVRQTIRQAVSGAVVAVGRVPLAAADAVHGLPVAAEAAGAGVNLDGRAAGNGQATGAAGQGVLGVLLADVTGVALARRGGGGSQDTEGEEDERRGLHGCG